jgi:hypothetical protein
MNSITLPENCRRNNRSFLCLGTSRQPLRCFFSFSFTVFTERRVHILRHELLLFLTRLASFFLLFFSSYPMFVHLNLCSSNTVVHHMPYLNDGPDVKRNITWGPIEKQQRLTDMLKLQEFAGAVDNISKFKKLKKRQASYIEYDKFANSRLREGYFCYNCIYWINIEGGCDDLFEFSNSSIIIESTVFLIWELADLYKSGRREDRGL